MTGLRARDRRRIHWLRRALPLCSGTVPNWHHPALRRRLVGNWRRAAEPPNVRARLEPQHHPELQEGMSEDELPARFIRLGDPARRQIAVCFDHALEPVVAEAAGQLLRFAKRLL